MVDMWTQHRADLLNFSYVETTQTPIGYKNEMKLIIDLDGLCSSGVDLIFNGETYRLSKKRVGMLVKLFGRRTAK